MSDILLIVLLVILFLAGIIFIPQLMMRRAIKQVIAIFRKHGATAANSAKHIDEMGIKPQGMFSMNFGLRDYKYHAVQALIKGEVVTVTEDGKVYLQENKVMLLKL
jgi:hypothetical protein